MDCSRGHYNSPKVPSAQRMGRKFRLWGTCMAQDRRVPPALKVLTRCTIIAQQISVSRQVDEEGWRRLPDEWRRFQFVLGGGTGCFQGNTAWWFSAEST